MEKLWKSIDNFVFDNNIKYDVLCTVDNETYVFHYNLSVEEVVNKVNIINIRTSIYNGINEK